MKLEDITAEVRPRGRWEAVDLGFALVRRHFGRLLLAWLVCVVPIWLAVLWSSQWISVPLAVFILWWWKPLYDRLPLFILSRALFGAPPRLRDTVRAWPGLFFKNWWHAVVATRLSGTRTLLLPVTMLEGLRGGERKARSAVLVRHSGGCAGSLTFVSVLYEGVLTMGLASLAFMFSPDEGTSFWIDTIFEAGYARTVPPFILWGAITCWLLAVTLIELFYTGGGFGLYLNTRTHLEGWDVELAFRRIGRRLAEAAVALAFLLAIPCAQAQEGDPIAAEKKEAAERMKSVLEDKDFIVHKKETTRWKSSGSSSSNLALGPLFEVLAYILFAAVLAVAIYFLVRAILRHRYALRGIQSPERDEAKTVARTIAGMDVTPESLPADLIAAARGRFLAGDAAGALSLLYRGSLSWLVNTVELPIRDSDTEGDCVRRVEGLNDSVSREYFIRLTRHWLTAAYAGKAPETSEMEALLTAWPFSVNRRGGLPA